MKSLIGPAAVCLMLVCAPAAALADRTSPPPNPATPIDDPIPGHIANGAIQGQLETLAEGKGLTAPNYGTFAPGQADTLYVVDQDGPLWAIDVQTGRKALALNTRPLLVALFPGDERGFLGVAFARDFPTSGRLYTYTSEPSANNPTGDPTVQPNHMSVVREWVVPPGARVPDPRARPDDEDQGVGAFGVRPATSRMVTSFVEPQFNHDGGAIFFGTRPADRDLLYITSGDGGCADDQNQQLGLAGEGPCIGHGAGSEQQAPNANGNGQDRTTPLGKILRLDPRGTFVNGGAPASIFAYGFRNPFRASSDRADLLGGTGEIWTADVGQNHVEEVDGRVREDGNYGWHVKEGSFLFDPSAYELFGFASDGFPFAFSPGVPPGMIDPDGQYDHDEGVAVLGGFVYRGSRFAELRGRYVFGDYSRGLNSGNGEVFYLDESDGATDPRRRTPKVFHLTNGPINRFMLGFGEDQRGELYALANAPGVPFEEKGIVMRVVRRCVPGRECRD